MSDRPTPSDPTGIIPGLRIALFYAWTVLIAGHAYYLVLTAGDVLYFLFVLIMTLGMQTLGDRILFWIDDTPIEQKLFDDDGNPGAHWWVALFAAPGIILGVMSPDFILWDIIAFARSVF